MESDISRYILEYAPHVSYWGIFGISLLANVVIPFPEEITLLVFGYFIGTGVLGFIPAMMVIIAGLFVSDSLIYLLAYKGNKLVTRFYNKIFSSPLLHDESFLQKHIVKIIIISRFLVQLRFIGPFVAGHTKLSYRKFALYDLFALFIYVNLFLTIGVIMGNKIVRIASGLGQIHTIVLLGVGIFLAYAILKFVLQASFWKVLFSFTHKPPTQ